MKLVVTRSDDRIEASIEVAFAFDDEEGRRLLDDLIAHVIGLREVLPEQTKTRTEKTSSTSGQARPKSEPPPRPPAKPVPKPDEPTTAAPVETPGDANVCVACDGPCVTTDTTPEQVERLNKFQKMVNQQLCMTCGCKCEQCGKDEDIKWIETSYTRWRKRLCLDCFKAYKPEAPEPEPPVEEGTTA